MTQLSDQLIITLPNKVLLEMILVQPGHFIMGSEESEASKEEGAEHIVHITRPYYIGKHPITVAQWQAIMEGNHIGHFPDSNRPKVNISWYEIGRPAGFLNSLNSHFTRIEPSFSKTYSFKLPTEAEWEYAAKGGPQFPLSHLYGKRAVELYTSFAGSDRLESCGWYKNNCNTSPMPVGLKVPNELGIHDLTGNVAEWCQDWYESNSYPYQRDDQRVYSDPPGIFERDGLKVSRGGSYKSSHNHSRLTSRDRYWPSLGYDDFGFRLVLSAD